MHYLLYGILIVSSVVIDWRLIYVLFIMMLLCNRKCIHNKETLFLSIAVASIILPDNYSTEFFFLIYFVADFILIDRCKIKMNQYLLLLCFFFFIAIFSTILNCVPMVNNLFSFVTFLPFVAFMFLIKDLGKKDFSRIYCLADDILVIELISTVVNFIFYHSSRGDDWSRGTFFRSVGSQSQLFIIASFLAIFYFDQYVKLKKGQKNLIKSIGALIMLFSTNCWTLSVFFALGVGLTCLLSLTPKRLVIAMLGICTGPLALCLVLKFAPGSISSPLKKILTDGSYFNYRFYKAVVYRITLFELPAKDIWFGLFGGGVGYYASRAALICTGFYADFYNRFYSPSISLYTRTYILDYLRLAATNGSSDYGSVLARPYSSVLSLIGECGYIGLIVFLLLLKKLMKNKGFGAKLLLCVWLSFCFVECYFEYAKVLVMLYFCLLLVCSGNIEHQNLRGK